MSQDAIINGMVKGCEVMYKLIEFFLSQKQKQIETLTKERDDLKKELADAKKEFDQNPKAAELKNKIAELETKIAEKEKLIEANEKACADIHRVSDAIYKQQTEYKEMNGLDMTNLTEEQKGKFNQMRQEYVGAVVNNLKDQGVTKEQFDAYLSNPEGAGDEIKKKVATAKFNAAMDKAEKDIMAKPENKDLPMMPSRIAGTKDISAFQEKINAALEKGAVSKAELDQDISKGLNTKSINNDAPAL